MGHDHGLQHLDQLLLEEPGEQRAAGVVSLDLGQLLVILEEEGQILVGDVHIRVPALSLVLLYCRLASAEGVLVDLILNLLSAVRQKD